MSKEVSNMITGATVLMGIPANQMYALANGKQKAVVKTTMPKHTAPPYTVYIYVNGSKHTMKKDGFRYPDKLLFVNGDITVDNMEFGCPYDTTKQELETSAEILSYCVIGKCKCYDYQILKCTESSRQEYSKDVGMTSLELIDMCNCKDMGVWYLSDFELFDSPKKLEDFGMVRPPQSWSYLDNGENK